jgi:hypothetical protein
MSGVNDRSLGGEIHPREASGPVPSDCLLIMYLYSTSVECLLSVTQEP